MFGNYVGNMTSKQTEKFTNVLATATGFDQHEIAKYVDAIIEPVSDSITNMIEKKVKKVAKEYIKKSVKKQLAKVLPKFLGKGLAKKVPIAGIAAGTAFAV